VAARLSLGIRSRSESAVRRTLWLLAMASSVVLLLGCDADEPEALLAEDICAAIDAEPSDELAFEEYEQSIARERRNGVDEDLLREAVESRCGRVVAAISETTEPAELAERSESESEPVDLREVVWAEQQWQTDCTDSGDPTPVGLAPASDEGRYWHNPSPNDASDAAMTYTVDLNSVVYGDVTGDGYDDAVFGSDCFFGNDFDFRIEVWSHDDNGEPKHLDPVLAYTKWDGVVEHFEVDDGRLRVLTSEPAPNEEAPHLNGYAVEVVTAWHFDGNAWQSDELSRTDTTPAPESPPEPSRDEPLSACDQLGFPGGDEEWCAETMEWMAECQREIDSDPAWVHLDGGLYENLETGEITTCDI